MCIKLEAFIDSATIITQTWLHKHMHRFKATIRVFIINETKDRCKRTYIIWETWVPEISLNHERAGFFAPGLWVIQKVL